MLAPRSRQGGKPRVAHVKSTARVWSICWKLIAWHFRNFATVGITIVGITIPFKTIVAALDMLGSQP
jgi:hypothetical protein